MINEIIEKISSETGLNEDEIKRMIEEKRLELSNLISEEGAAYIVAKELGVRLRQTEQLNIENIIPGMQNIDIVGKITKITPIREYNGKKFMSIFISDSTGSIRLPLWDNEIEKISGLSEGDVIRVRGLVKEGLFGPELRIGKYGSITKSDEKIENVIVTRRVERSQIDELREGLYKEIRSPIVQIFESNVFYEICPNCGLRLKEDEKGFRCEQHGIVEPDYNVAISGILDDGTGNIRFVIFNENVEKLIGMKKNEMKRLFDQKKKVSVILEKIPLGKDFIFEGRVRRNEFFDRLEFIVNNVKNVDVKKEIEMIIEKLE
ncbi:MAG: DUF2240 family protein [Candidatus Aenigmatarchaeota archaeon]